MLTAATINPHKPSTNGYSLMSDPQTITAESKNSYSLELMPTPAAGKLYVAPGTKNSLHYIQCTPSGQILSGKIENCFLKEKFADSHDKFLTYLQTQEINSLRSFQNEILQLITAIKISTFQRIMLFGDWLYHANSESSFQYITLGIQITAMFKLSITGLVIWQVLSYIIGLYGAHADYLTCRKQVIIANIKPKSKPDCLTITNTILTGLASIIGTPIAVGNTIDNSLELIFKTLERPILGFSYIGFTIGLCVGLLSAIGAIYCHLRLNTNHQDHPEDAKISLPWTQRLLLLGDRINHGNSEVAFQYKIGGTLLLAHLGAPIAAILAWQLFSYAIGILSASADIRPCTHAVKTWNRNRLFTTPNRQTIINAVITGIASLTATPFETAETLDDTFEVAYQARNITFERPIGYTPADQSLSGGMQTSYSVPGIILGCAIGILCFLGSTWVHLLLNTQCQAEEEKENPRESEHSPKFFALNKKVETDLNLNALNTVDKEPFLSATELSTINLRANG